MPIENAEELKVRLTDHSQDDDLSSPHDGSPIQMNFARDRQRAAVPLRNGLSLSGLLVFTLALLGIRYGIPPLVEELQYRSTRGRQRAEYEIATQAISSSGLEELSSAFQLVSQRVTPSVVHIKTQRSEKEDDKEPSDVGDRRRQRRRPVRPPGHFFNRPIEQGSGVIVSEEGLILTNHHVVDDAQSISVYLSDGRSVSAELLGWDDLTDLALLKIKAKGLIAAEWGDSDALREGALVWALGSPFGLKRSITCGIVSATKLAGIAGNPHQDYIQTDAAVNPGSSGGPLVDTNGRVVGINTAILGDTYQGVSFAVPSSVARRVCEQLFKDGRIQRGWLGVHLGELTRLKAEELGLSETAGALVNDVLAQSSPARAPARRAGIEPGDVIVRWRDKEIESKETLIREVGLTRAGTKASVLVMRQGKPLELEVLVGQRPLELYPR